MFAVLLDCKSVRVILLILHGCVVASFASATCHCDDDSVVLLSHGSNSLKASYASAAFAACRLDDGSTTTAMGSPALRVLSSTAFRLSSNPLSEFLTGPKISQKKMASLGGVKQTFYPARRNPVNKTTIANDENTVCSEV